MTREMDLSGEWEILPASAFKGNYETVGSWRKARLPGHWQQLPEFEFYAGKMVYRKAFKFAPQQEKRIFLRLGGVFYRANAHLNGRQLGSNEGYFFPVDYEVTETLAKDNVLILEVDCPDEKDKTRKRMLTGVFHHWDCIDPRTNPGGVWLPVEILSTGPARIQDPMFTTVYLDRDNSTARINGRATIDTREAARFKVRISFIPRTFEGEARVFERRIDKPAGLNTYHYNLDLNDPVLWWTHDHGKPDLYTLRLEVFEPGAKAPSDSWETPFGVRTFELRNYQGFLNGKKIYLRGNNYPPGDTRLATMTRERCEQDVRLARECNLNILRVHAHVDHPLFYQVCDEQGMLLWQDFPMQWYYRPQVEPQALRQVERMIFTLGNHPSIGAWCMHNEPLKQFDNHKFIGPIKVARWLFSIFVWSADRDRMDRNLARRARFLDPHRFVTRSSGERGLFRPAGDVHYYYGWYFGPLSWFHRKYKRSPQSLRFITEFGSQSLPNPESARRFMAAKIEDVDWKKLEKRHHYQPLFMKMVVNPRKFKTLEDFIRATQDYQSKLNRYYIDRVRSLKYKPSGGCVPFMLLDSNPAVQWSIIDYWREPKSSYYAMQKAMSPVYAFTILEKTRYGRNETVRLPLYAVNDTWEEAPVKVGLKVTSPAGDTVLDEAREQTLPPDCMATAIMNPEVKLRWQGRYRVRISLSGPGVEQDNDYELVTI